MMFSKKKITIAYTLEECTKCGMMKKRKFRDGDILFSESEKCGSCGQVSIIQKIFGEQLEQ